MLKRKAEHLEVDRVELEDARWFSREEAIALIERRHPDGLMAPTPMAIAHHLLKRWAYKAVRFANGTSAIVLRAKKSGSARRGPADPLALVE